MKKIFFLVTVFLICTTMLIAQNGTRLTGFDAATVGRGGTVTGFFDNPSLIMNNPAGLSFMKTSQLDLSFTLMAPEVRFKNNINNARGDNNLFPMGSISYSHRRAGDITWGVGIFTQGGMGADFDLNHELYKDMVTGKYVKQPYHSKYAVVQGGGAMAYKLSQQVSVGITADLVYSQVEFQMPMSISPAMMKGVIDPSTGATFGDLLGGSPESGGLGYTELVASSKMQPLTSYGFNGKIGLAYKPCENFSMGINYSIPVNLKYKHGSADMDMTYQMNNAYLKIFTMVMEANPGLTEAEANVITEGFFSQMGIDLTKGVVDKYNASAEFGLPQSVSGGLYFSPSKKLRLALDAEWINWAKAFDQMDIALTNGTNPNINTMIGTNGKMDIVFPMKWKNTIVIRTGAEYNVTKSFMIKGGYVYGSNPVPSSTIFPVFPAIVKNHVTAGFSIKLSKLIAINGAYEHAFKATEHADANSLIANEYNNSSSSLENNIIHLSISWFLK